MSNNSFGMHASNIIVFANEKDLKLKNVVDERVGGSVVTYSEQKQQFENGKIFDWVYNGYIKAERDAVYIETVGPECNRGRFGVALTNDCSVLTQRGWIAAQDLTEHDSLLSRYKSVINGSLEEFVWGTLMGGSSLKTADGSNTRTCLSFADSKNPEYAKWKAVKLNAALGVKIDGKCRCSSNYTFELTMIKNSNIKNDLVAMLERHYSNLAMAVWYMDNGRLDVDGRERVTISIKRFCDSPEKFNRIVELLEMNGVPCSGHSYKYGSLFFTRESLNNLFTKICQYIPECMQYKLTKQYRGQYKDFELSYEALWKKCYVPILLRRPLSPKQFESNIKYTIATANGNCLVGSSSNGVVVKCAAAQDVKKCEQSINKHRRIGISANTRLQYATYNFSGDIINRKGGTAKKLYERFHSAGVDMRTNRFDHDGLSFSIPFVNDDGYVAHQKISNVLRCPASSCYELLTESGLSITVASHQMLLFGPNSYKEVSSFVVGDEIMIHNGTCFSKEHAERKKYFEILVKYHPHGIKKIVDQKYEYYRVQVSHAVYEAHMNKMSYEDYVCALNKWEKERINQLWTIDKELYDIHHKDLNSENNELLNLELLTKAEHGQLHASKRKKNLSFVPVIDKIRSITMVEPQETYVIVCDQLDNCVANKLIIQAPMGNCDFGKNDE